MHLQFVYSGCSRIRPSTDTITTKESTNTGNIEWSWQRQPHEAIPILCQRTQKIGQEFLCAALSASTLLQQLHSKLKINHTMRYYSGGTQTSITAQKLRCVRFQRRPHQRNVDLCAISCEYLNCGPVSCAHRQFAVTEQFHEFRAFCVCVGHPSDTVANINVYRIHRNVANACGQQHGTATRNNDSW